jgi:hypothetical protein
MKNSMTAVLFLLGASFLSAQSTQSNSAAVPLPLKKASLFSSGVAYFEHSGTVTGNAGVTLFFNRSTINDALKSLVINDAESSSPSINYLSDTTLLRTLQSLKIDLSGDAGIVTILSGLQGFEITVALSGPGAGRGEQVRGRIVAVKEARTDVNFSRDGFSQATISLSTTGGLRIINLNDVRDIQFIDSEINTDLQRALDLISMSNTTRSRNLDITLPGKRRREVKISYVIPSPVWKISYRLDLRDAGSFLQAWTIIDNDSDTDWENVEVSLVSGRPVSFVQPLYPPAYLNRPVLPLSGAGFADAESYESGYGANYGASREVSAEADSLLSAGGADSMREMRAPVNQAMLMKSAVPSGAAPSPVPVPTVVATGSSASAQAAGEQFEFTLKKPVTIKKQQSAMLPLFEGGIKARKILVFSGEKAARLGSIHPAISVELNNTTGAKLPAGPITVFDGGAYAGDALIGFFNENEKRLVSFGDDLAVTGSVSTNAAREISRVAISRGLMTVQRKIIYKKTYTIRNTSSEAKKLIIEHPKTAGTTLTQPASFSEQTDRLYRFEADLSSNQILTLDVAEELPGYERIMLINLQTVTLLSYSTNEEIPENIRAVFAEASGKKIAVDNAKKHVGDLEQKRQFQIAEQERVRANLQAVGGGSEAGQNYLRRLTGLDDDIAESGGAIDAARLAEETAQSDYEDYIAGLEI